MSIKLFFFYIKIKLAYNSQSTAMIYDRSSVGKPTVLSTINMVTSAALGILAAPILVAVAAILEINKRSEK
jgi:hypothetical protein